MFLKNFFDFATKEFFGRGAKMRNDGQPRIAPTKQPEEFFNSPLNLQK